MPELTPAQKAAQEAQVKLTARIAELKSHEGKMFKRKDDETSKTTFKIIRYEGIGTLMGGIQAHLFRVESFNPGSIWTPPATQFLSDHEEIPAVETVKPEIV